MNVPAAVAAIEIAAQSGNLDPLDEAYRDATTVFDLPVSRVSPALSPDGLYPQGQVRCEFRLYCDGSVGCFPALGKRTERRRWRRKTGRTGITP